MIKTKHIFMAALLVFVMLFSIACSDDSENNNNDSNLGANNNNNSNTLSDTKPTIITIKGTQYSTDLTKLDLYDNGLKNSDIELLKYMTNLIELDLSDNPIRHLSILARLKNLESLNLEGTQISAEHITGLREVMPNTEIYDDY